MLAQSIRRAHRVAVAMESKAFVSDKKRTYYYPSVFTKYDPLVVIVLCVSIGVAFVLAAHLPIFGIEDVRYKNSI
ncbi:Energy-coupling factor transporter transmembrane protein EcfT [compost metagenome]